MTEEEADAAFDRLVSKGSPVPQGTTDQQSALAVVSQCLIGVSPESRVGVIKFQGRIALIPDNALATSMHKLMSDGLQ